MTQYNNIEHADGRRYATTHAFFLSYWQALGFVETGAERTAPANIEPPTIAHLPEDDGAWDSGPTYNISHADGRRYAVTYDNYVHYYQPLGFTIGIGEHGEAVPSSFGLLTEAGGLFVTEIGDSFVLEAA